MGSFDVYKPYHPENIRSNENRKEESSLKETERTGSALRSGESRLLVVLIPF